MPFLTLRESDAERYRRDWLVVVSEAVSRVVELTGVNRVIPIYTSLEDALT